MEIELYNRDNIDLLKWPDDKDGQFAKSYIYPMVKKGPIEFIDNTDAEMQVLVFAGNIFPLILGNPQQKFKNSYVCSPTAHYIDYGREEINIELKDKPFLRKASHMLINGLESFVTKLGFEKVLYVNNWLLSTNLYTKFDINLLTEVRDFLVEKFPDYPIIFRSINEIYNADIYKKLDELNFHHVFRRQVYILETLKGEYKKKESYQKDLKAKRKSKYYWEDADKIKPENIPRMRWLYDALYIEKYSELNPTFNEKFLELTMNVEGFTYKVLKKDDEIYAVFGYFERDGFITAPLFGYDTSLPSSEGLYKLTALKILEDAIAKGWIVHMSSGVSKFKMHRGAEPSTEYNMVYYAHLPKSRRIPWKMMELLTDKAIVPVMKKYGL